MYSKKLTGDIEKEHYKIVEKLHEKMDLGKNYQTYLNHLAILRKSLG